MLIELIEKMLSVVKPTERGLIEDTHVSMIGNSDFFLRTKTLIHLFISNELLLYCPSSEPFYVPISYLALTFQKSSWSH